MDPAGMITLLARPYVVIPAALRRRCRMRTGDRVLLAALPREDALAAYPLAVVDRAIRAHAPIDPGPTARRQAMTVINPAPPTGQPARPEVAAALLVLERMGLSPSGLLPGQRSRPTVPTFAEYIPVVSQAVTAGTRRAYGPYWNRVIGHWGDRHLDEPTPSDVRQLMTHVKTPTRQ